MGRGCPHIQIWFPPLDTRLPDCPLNSTYSSQPVFGVDFSGKSHTQRTGHFLVGRGWDTLCLPPLCSGRPKAPPSLGTPPFGVLPPVPTRTYYVFRCMFSEGLISAQGDQNPTFLPVSIACCRKGTLVFLYFHLAFSMSSEPPLALPVNTKRTTNPSNSYTSHPHSYRLTPTPLPPGPRPSDRYHTDDPTPSQPKVFYLRVCAP